MTPADFQAPRAPLRQRDPRTDEVTPKHAPKTTPIKVDDPERVRWHNTPFAKRLEMLIAGEGPAWIANEGARIEWLKDRLEEKARLDATPDVYPDGPPNEQGSAGVSTGESLRLDVAPAVLAGAVEGRLAMLVSEPGEDDATRV
jgi:hypothetical protein